MGAVIGVVILVSGTVGKANKIARRAVAVQEIVPVRVGDARNAALFVARERHGFARRTGNAVCGDRERIAVGIGDCRQTQLLVDGEFCAIGSLQNKFCRVVGISVITVDADCAGGAALDNKLSAIGRRQCGAGGVRGTGLFHESESSGGDLLDLLTLRRPAGLEREHAPIRESYRDDFVVCRKEAVARQEAAEILCLLPIRAQAAAFLNANIREAQPPAYAEIALAFVAAVIASNDLDGNARDRNS